MPADTIFTPLTDAEFRAQAGAVLSGIEATVDRWLQQDLIDIDASRTGGLLELSFPNGSKIVINTQPPCTSCGSRGAVAAITSSMPKAVGWTPAAATISSRSCLPAPPNRAAPV